jgi:hypothetical protein
MVHDVLLLVCCLLLLLLLPCRFKTAWEHINGSTWGK